MIGAINGENKIVTSLAWLSGDLLIVGTCEAELLLSESGETRNIYCAISTDEIDLTVKEYVKLYFFQFKVEK